MSHCSYFSHIKDYSEGGRRSRSHSAGENEALQGQPSVGSQLRLEHILWASVHIRTGTGP